MHRAHVPDTPRAPERARPAPITDPRSDWLLSLGNQGAQRALARLSTNTPVPDAVVAAAPNAIYPQGVQKVDPQPGDIAFDPKLGDDAVTRPELVEADPANYWHWIVFGPTTVRETDANTEAVITHELVHVRQFQVWWQDWNQQAAVTGESWMTYVARLSAGGRQEGAQELEAHATVLGYLPKLRPVERRQALIGLFDAFARAETFVPPAGVVPEATAAATAPDILAAFAALRDAQEAFGYALWRALIGAKVGREEWLRTLRDLEPIARLGYADTAARHSYDFFLQQVGLTFADVF